jgi:2,3-bisphosphoglycerate-independent phosphoglycerate mutase
MDGWGISTGSEKYDATKLANPVNVPKLEQEEKFIKIKADGENVGLPEGQMGNSEVGHLNLGAGRIVYQDLLKINNAIKDGSFFKNEKFLEAINHTKKNNSALHIYGLVSTGGVHSSLDHLLALIQMAKKEGLNKVYVHAFLDGRDTPPASACEYLQTVENELSKQNLPPIASAVGRYYIMDRDNRWERVEKGYNCLLLGEGEKANSVVEGVKKSYENGVTDEFVLPIVAGGEETRIRNNDSIIFFNYRPDRAREITKAINFKDFDGFDRKKVLNNIYYCTMTSYDASFDFPVAFPKFKPVNILGDILEQNGVNQFRTAETEKYAHVTFFFNGGEEVEYPGENRILVNSPKVATYDLQPEMSVYEVRDNFLKEVENYDVTIMNLANGDMVGHTGVYEAAISAVEHMDKCLTKIYDKVSSLGGTLIIIADHGNCDVMWDENHKPVTSHTTNPVHCIITKKGIERNDGKLADVAPTMLELLNLPIPSEMTGKSLIK